MGSTKFGQNYCSNSFDFAAIDKYPKTKHYQDKSPPDMLTYGILKMATETYLYWSVKISAVIAEILPI